MNSRPIPTRKILRRLFLTLFLRGRSSRGLQKSQAPKSVGSKLWWSLLLYLALGAMVFFFQDQPVFTVSLYLHGMTLVFVGMFIASSAGEVLFNKEESDILLHRPITARALLWAKIGVLVEVSLWLAGAFNFGGIFVGMMSPDGGGIFLLAHALSTILEALFCSGIVVLGYELCLRWFGRERLDGLMTTVQVIVSIAAVVGGQMVPQLIGRFGGKIAINVKLWWIALLPPAWFAGIDDLICGNINTGSSALAGVGLAATVIVIWLAFGRLARDYGRGLQTLGESTSPKQARSGRHRWLGRLAAVPPLNWWLRDSVTRAAFLLTASYLVRDRETKLRIYPSLAPILVMPVMMVLQAHGRGGFEASGFMIALSGAYLGLVPLMGINILRYSQQWQASDLFRAAPLHGPAKLCHGVRRAVLCCLALPFGILFGVISWALTGKVSDLLMLLPGMIALPVYAMVGCLRGNAVPFMLPTEEAKATNRGAIFMGAMVVAVLLAFVVSWARSTGWFWWLILVEIVGGAILYFAIRASLNEITWWSME
jgi:hypothetical protein